MRLFFALWPDEAVRDRLAETAASLPRGCGRQVPAANFHITLEFIGSASEALYASLAEAAARVTVEPFELSLSRFGYWPRPRIVWFGPHHMPPELLALVFKLRAVAGECGLEPESRPYRPHVSLLRKVARQPQWPEVKPVDWQATDFVLCQSLNGPKGPRYEVLQRWPLGSGTLVSQSSSV